MIELKEKYANNFSIFRNNEECGEISYYISGDTLYVDNVFVYKKNSGVYGETLSLIISRNPQISRTISVLVRDNLIGLYKYLDLDYSTPVTRIFENFDLKEIQLGLCRTPAIKVRAGLGFKIEEIRPSDSASYGKQNDGIEVICVKG